MQMIAGVCVQTTCVDCERADGLLTIGQRIHGGGAVAGLVASEKLLQVEHWISVAHRPSIDNHPAGYPVSGGESTASNSFCILTESISGDRRIICLSQIHCTGSERHHPLNAVHGERHDVLHIQTRAESLRHLVKRGYLGMCCMDLLDVIGSDITVCQARSRNRAKPAFRQAGLGCRCKQGFLTCLVCRDLLLVCCQVGQEGINDVRVKLVACVLAQKPASLIPGHALSILAIFANSVEAIGNCENTSGQWNLDCLESIRITATVPPLVMVPHYEY